MKPEDGTLIHNSDFVVHAYFPSSEYGQAYRVEHDGQVREFKDPMTGAADDNHQPGAATAFMQRVLDRVDKGAVYRDAVAAEWDA